MLKGQTLCCPSCRVHVNSETEIIFFSRCIRCCYADFHSAICFLHQAGERANEVCPKDRGKKIVVF